MGAVTWDSFERYKQRGLDARKAGQWDSAATYLKEAARTMLELSKEAQGDELREGRLQTAKKLLELAQDSEQAKKENRGRTPIQRGSSGGKGGKSEGGQESEGGPDANQWVVKERPSIRFADVAGLEA